MTRPILCGALGLLALLLTNQAVYAASPRSETMIQQTASFVPVEKASSSLRHDCEASLGEASAGVCRSGKYNLSVGFWPTALDPSEMLSGVNLLGVDSLSDISAIHGSPTRFYLTNASPATFSMKLGALTASNIHGSIEFTQLDPLTAFFSYSPAGNDLLPFNLLFSAVSSSETNFADVAVVPIPALPDEQDVLPPGPARPLADAKDYVLRTVTTSSIPFNGRPTSKAVEASGKLVVIRAGHPNGLFQFNANETIRSLTIRADTVRFEGAITLPGTAVFIAARQVEGIGVGTIQGAGSVVVSSRLDDWLTPPVARSMLAHARDLYLYGYFNDARDALEELHGLIVRSSPVLLPSLADSKILAEFTQIDQEVGGLTMQIIAHRDFFGNPAGYVPLLSFEVLLEFYSSEIRPALSTLWLSYWMNNRIADITDKWQSLLTVKSTLRDELEVLVAELPRLAMSMTALQDEASGLEQRMRFLDGRLTARYEELRRQAEEAANQAKKQKKKNAWRKVVNTVGFVLQVVPVFQPALGAVGSGLQFVAQVSGKEPVGFATDFNRVLQTVQNPAFLQGISNLQSLGTDVLKVVGNPNADFSSILSVVSRGMTNVPQAVASVRGAWRQTDSKYTDLQQQIADAKGSFPEMNVPVVVDGVTAGLLDQISATTAEMALVGERIAKTLERISHANSRILEITLSIDSVNDSLVASNDSLDHRVSSHIREMEGRAKSRLRYFHYLLAKAYEFRLLKPYPRALDVEQVLSKMVAVAESSRTGKEELSETEYATLVKGTYDDILAEIAVEVVSGLTQRFQRRGSLQLTPAEVLDLNAGRSVIVNFVERGLIDPDLQDVRLAWLSLTNLGVQAKVPTRNSRLTVEARHAGENTLRSGDNFFYFLSTGGAYWAATYNVNDGSVVPDERSLLQDSLICAILGLRGVDCHANSEKFAPLAAWTDVELKRSTFGTLPGNLVLTNLTVDYILEFARLPREYRSLEVFIANPGLHPVVLMDRPDRRGRQHGVGRFTRSFRTGDKVTVTAPKYYGSWRFVKWVDGFGNELADPPVTSNVFAVDLNLQYSIQAVYENMDADSDGLPDWFELALVGSTEFEPQDLLHPGNAAGGTLFQAYLNQTVQFLTRNSGYSNGKFQFSMVGESGVAYTVERSANLVEWVEIARVQGANEPIQFVDPSAGPAAFYRVLPASP